jgi:hypothetical protein
MAVKAGVEPALTGKSSLSPSETHHNIKKDFIRNPAADFTPLASHTIRESSISTCP